MHKVDAAKPLGNVKFKFEPIPEAATFRPTIDEFADPLGYVNQIRAIAESYGICKIVPPRSWKPPFCIDMDAFKFTPRVQRLHELEANTRIKINFLEKLSKFWDLQGHKFRIPILERKPIDLYKLYKTVESMGGIETVTKNKQWCQLLRKLDFKEPTSARYLKIHFENILYPYLLFEAGVTLPHLQQGGPDKDIESSYSSFDEESIDMAQNKKKKVAPKKQEKIEDKIELIKCLNCKRGDDEAFILLCDGCDDSYHTFCLIPALKEIPKGDWRCPKCIAEICKKPTEQYGFEQSKKCYTLNQFGDMANKFKQEYFQKNGLTNDNIEEEFWRILSSPDEPVMVEYGADLHTQDKGSGFPTSANRARLKPNEEEYIKSPWNLNNLPLQEKSVLSQMNVEISGMKVPWAYVGMCFSCFCWHVEDHWSYSINYLHWGSTKTWYGVPGGQAEKFEQVMKKNASELFEKSPDLLHHLATIMNPNTLRQNEVSIFKINQNAGEFVITFPRAYHAGFNQGFNFAEAVNFCPADWMHLGRNAIESYKIVKRHTVFSHDELVCKVATNRDLIEINLAFAVQRELSTIYSIEKQSRTKFIEKSTHNIATRQFNPELLTDDDRTCDYCKTTCYISMLKCNCTSDKLVCLNHYEHMKTICKASKKFSNSNNAKHHQYTLFYKYTLEELFTISSKLKKRIDEYKKWCFSVESIVEPPIVKIDYDSDDSVILVQESNTGVRKKPNINKLRELLDEAIVNNYPRAKSNSNKVSVKSIKKPKVIANECLFSSLEREFDEATKCQIKCREFIEAYKTQKNNIDISEHKLKAKDILTLNGLKELYKHINKLACELDYTTKEMIFYIYNESLAQEKNIHQLISEWKIVDGSKVKQALTYTNVIKFSDDIVENLKLMEKQSIWFYQVEMAGENPASLTIEILREFCDRVLSERLLESRTPKSRNTVQQRFEELDELLTIARAWDDRARKALDSKPPLKLSELEDILEEGKCIPIHLERCNKLEESIKEAKSWISDVEKFLEVNVNIKRPIYPHLNDLSELLKRSHELPVRLEAVPAIEIRLKSATEWTQALKSCFLKSESNTISQISFVNNSKTLMELLTPRTDLVTLVNKIQSNLISHTHSSSLVNLSSKRQRTKSPCGSLTINQITESETIVSKNLFSSILSIDNIEEFYNENKFISVLSEKYKTLQLKEIELMKQLRKLNQEKINHQLNFIIKIQDQNEDSLSQANTNNDQISTPNTMLKFQNQKFPINIKCCSCFKSIASAINTNCAQQCKLCLGLFHNSCKNITSNQKSKKFLLYFDTNENFIMCNSCERSRRPNFDLVIEQSILFEKLKVTSNEGNALQLFVERVSKWQERFSNYIFTLRKDSPSIEKALFEKNSTISAYNLLPSLKKAELNDIYIEGLLLEVDTDEIKQMDNIFKERYKIGEFEQFKLKIKEISLLSADTVATTTTVNLSESNIILGEDMKTKINTPLLTGPTFTSVFLTDVKRPKLKKINSKGKEKSGDESSSNNKSLNSSLSGKSIKRILEVTLDNDEDKIINDDSDSDEEFCAATKCNQPTGNNIKWVRCDGSCNRWFHLFCVGISKIKKKDSYLCGSCKEKNTINLNNQETKMETFSILENFKEKQLISPDTIV